MHNVMHHTSIENFMFSQIQGGSLKSETRPTIFRQHRAESHCRFLHAYRMSYHLVMPKDSPDLEVTLLAFEKAVEATFGVLVAKDDPKMSLVAEYAESIQENCTVLDSVGCESLAKHLYDQITANGAQCTVIVAEHMANFGGYGSDLGYISGKIYNHNLGWSNIQTVASPESPITGVSSIVSAGTTAVGLCFTSKELDVRNWVVDFGSMKDLKFSLEKILDHAFLHYDEEMIRKLQLEDLVYPISTSKEGGFGEVARTVHTYASTWLKDYGYTHVDLHLVVTDTPALDGGNFQHTVYK